MYILFNSASRRTYFDNLIKITSLPTGSVTTMRYSEKNLPNTLNIPEKSKCLIIYIDRFNPSEYKYIPIRQGTILKKETEKNLKDERVFLTVQLDTYVNINDDNNIIKKITENNNAPKLQNGDPEVTDDGRYVIEIDDPEAIENGQEFWFPIVDRLLKTRSLKDKDVVLLKMEILDKEDNIVSVCSASEAYRLIITYYNPKELEHSFDVNFYLPLKSKRPSKHTIGCKMDKVPIPFEVDKVYQRSSAVIDIKDSSMNLPVNIDVPLKSVFFDWLNISLIGFFILILVLQYCVVDYDLVAGANWDNRLLRGLVELSKWICGFGLFVRLGKPIS